MSNKRTQCQLILTHMINHGYITPLIADNYGIERLASRIFDLRKNYAVTREMCRDDLGKKYARYSLTNVTTTRAPASAEYRAAA